MRKVVVRNISSNTGGTESPRVFFKEVRNQKDYNQWIDKLPSSGSKYQGWGMYLNEYLKNQMSTEPLILGGAGIASAEIYKRGSITYIHIYGVYGESFEMHERGRHDIVFFNVGTRHNPRWKRIGEGYVLFSFISHEDSGRYNDYYIILSKSERTPPNWIPKKE